MGIKNRLNIKYVLLKYKSDIFLQTIQKLFVIPKFLFPGVIPPIKIIMPPLVFPHELTFSSHEGKILYKHGNQKQRIGSTKNKMKTSD